MTTGNTAKMRAEGSKDVTIKNPPPAGEVDKAIEELLNKILRRTDIGSHDATEDLRRDLYHIASHASKARSLLTTYAEDNERLEADREKWNEIAEGYAQKLTAAQAEIEKLRGENKRLEWVGNYNNDQFNHAFEDNQSLREQLAASQAQAEEMRKALEEPDHIYDPNDWEYTHNWEDRNDMVDDLPPGEIKKFATLVCGPDKWAAHVILTTDDAGGADDTEIQWFDSEEAARTALSLIKGGER